ncbi:hypothetical protein OSTOST_05644 [Ostertagia ostertagi]
MLRDVVSIDLPKRNPSSDTFEQCSILRRLSSTCPVDGIIFCDAAPDTNPARMQIEVFNAAGGVVRTYTNTGTTLAATVSTLGQQRPDHGTLSSSHLLNSPRCTVMAVRFQVFCRNGVWTARVSSTGTDQFIPITFDGSTGADKGYVIGSAINK